MDDKLKELHRKYVEIATLDWMFNLDKPLFLQPWYNLIFVIMNLGVLLGLIFENFEGSQTKWWVLFINSIVWGTFFSCGLVYSLYLVYKKRSSVLGP